MFKRLIRRLLHSSSRRHTKGQYYSHSSGAKKRSMVGRILSSSGHRHNHELYGHKYYKNKYRSHSS